MKMLSEQELNVLRSQGLISAQEIAFRNEGGQLVAENVLTKAQRAVGGGTANMRESKNLLLDQRTR